MYINPGECGGWLKGRSTVAILDTEKMQAEIIDLPLNF
jgi:predicted phosphodiesterase